MKWSFDPVYFLIGFALLIAGALILKFHQKIADNLAGGMSSYDKVKLFGVIACAVGLLLVSNLHTTILYLIFHLIMPNQFP